MIIAEAGVNHNGDPLQALRLVDAAADCGADVVKFQTFKAEELAVPGSPKAEYQKGSSTAQESQLEMLKRLELPRDAHHPLQVRCTERGIEFLSTAFDLESLDFLHSLNLSRFKIPSGEITNLPYLRRVGSFGRPVILSTGMCSIADVEAAIDALESAGSLRSNIIVLHCSTDYPTRMEDVNLRAMETMGRAFGVQTGYSDHTKGFEVSLAAVALGATVIEKHFTLDSRDSGPDHSASLEVPELKAMVQAIRNLQKALGDGIKRPGSGEKANIRIARKSIVARIPIRQGELFTADNLAMKRPGTGISPMRLDEIVGRPAPRSFLANEAIRL